MRQLVLSGLIVLLTACSPAAPSSSAQPPVSSGPKSPIAGLIDMQTIAWHNQDDGQPDFTLDNVAHFPGLFGGVVINATWAQMQPAAGGAVDFSRVDAALGQVRSYNAAHADAPLGVKLRIFAGNQAPSWAKQIDGGPVMLRRNPQGCPSAPCPISVGKVWDASYITAWRAFQAAVAARYDAEPLIRAVSVTSCGMQTDEPFVPTVDTAARANLRQAGYTDDLEKSCLMGAIQDYSAWKLTPIDYTFNPFNLMAGGNDVSFPTSVMKACRDALGGRCLLGNHALSPAMSAQNAEVVKAIASMGRPIYFQTDSPANMKDDWTGTLALAAQNGATAVELWPDAKYKGFMTLTVGQVTALRDALPK